LIIEAGVRHSYPALPEIAPTWAAESREWRLFLRYAGRAVWQHYSELLGKVGMKARPFLSGIKLLFGWLVGSIRCGPFDSYPEAEMDNATRRLVERWPVDPVTVTRDKRQAIRSFVTYPMMQYSNL
jgi:hypothetical protein